MILTQHNKQYAGAGPTASGKSIEDYRRDIKILKLKYLQLQENFQAQQKKIEWYNTKLRTLEKVSQKNLSSLDISQINQQPNQSLNQSKVGSGNNYLGADQQVMEQFANRCKMYLGMTPESLFRAADFKQEGVIRDVVFKQFLLNTKLNLKAQHIQRIIQLCDQDCTGNITRENYCNCLQAFQINQEANVNSSQSNSTSDNRTYTQKSFYKFCDNLIQQLISPQICYKHIDQNNTFIYIFFEAQQTLSHCYHLQIKEGSFSYEQFYGFTTQLMKNVNDTEVIGIFTYLDVEKTQQIGQEYFVVQTKKMMRIVAQEKNININNFIDLKASNGINNNNNQGNGIEKENKGDNHDTNCDHSRGQDQFHPNKFIPVAKVDISKLIQKFVNSYKLNIPNLLKTIVDNMMDIKSGILLQDIFAGFKQLKNFRKYSDGDKLLFFKGLDIGLNGSIDYEELIKFYSKHKQSDWPIDFIFYLFARILLVLDIDAEQYFKYQGYNSSQVLKKQEFVKFAKSVFWIEEINVSSELFQFLDKEQRNDIYISALIDQVDYEIAEQKRIFFGVDPDLNSTNKSFASSKKGHVKDITELESFKEMDQNSKLQHIKKTALSDVNVSLQLMQSIINEIKPALVNEDYFLKHEVGDEKEIIKTKWDTILNDEVSCLKKCIEIVTEMNQKGLQEWTDYEFGPIEETDPFGSKSMYYNSNDIPAGCPEPENVRWLRLNEIVDAYVENVGEDNLTEKQKKELQHIHFLYDGAQSNDVKQSKYLGDCWFVSALSIISEYNEYVDGEFDPHKSDQTDDQKSFMMSRGTYPPLFHFLSKYGIYVMKFFKNYRWRYVIIDDRLPCLESGEIIYSQCDTKNEFWVSLIEKAYAKIHSCYQALTSGDVGQGLQDLTGNLSIKIKLDNYKITEEDIESGRCPTTIDIGEKINTRTTDPEDVWKKLQQSKEIFWEILRGFKDKGCLIGCSADGDSESIITLDGERTGIYSGHAYSLNYMMQLDYINEEEKNNHNPENPHQNHRLLIVRNPWGYGEWQLKWSENADYSEKVEQYMPQIQKFFDSQEKRAKQLGVTPPERYEQAEDGKFLICYKDWRRIYNNLFICLLFSDAWSGFRIKGSWNTQFSSGILKKSEQSFLQFAQKNPQYVIELKNKSGNTEKSIPFFVNLAQNDGRLFNGEKYPYEKIQQSMMLCLFELDSKESKLEKYSESKMITNSGKYSQRREVQLDQRCMLEYGKRYCLLPSIKNEITEVNDEHFFYLNIFGRCNREDVTITRVNGKQEFPIKELGVNAVSQIDYEQTSEFKNTLIQSVNKQLKTIKI